MSYISYKMYMFRVIPKLGVGSPRSSADRAPLWRRGGRGFESRRGHPIQPLQAGTADERPSQPGGLKADKGRWIAPIPPLFDSIIARR